jgi:hypothetical protein
LAKRLPRAAVDDDRCRDGPAQDYAKVRCFLTAMSNRFVRFKRHDPPAIDELLQSLGREILKQGDGLLKEGWDSHGLECLERQPQDGPIAPGRAYWTKVLLGGERRGGTMKPRPEQSAQGPARSG